jgi:hypothetical protein
MSQVREIRRRIAFGLAVTVLVLFGASSLTNAVLLPIQDSAVMGTINLDGLGVHGIVVVGGFDKDARITASFHGLLRDRSYRVVGSTQSCFLGYSDASTIFGFVIYGVPNPFVRTTRVGLADQLDGLKSFRLLLADRANTQIGCVRADHFVPGLP